MLMNAQNEQWIGSPIPATPPFWSNHRWLCTGLLVSKLGGGSHRGSWHVRELVTKSMESSWVPYMAPLIEEEMSERALSVVPSNYGGEAGSD
jgi:hypothetical protein